MYLSMKINSNWSKYLQVYINCKLWVSYFYLIDGKIN